MEFRASHRFAPISARKARLVVDMVRGRPVNQALEVLQVTNKRASVMTQKVIKAALASAEDREDVEVDLNRLYIASAWVDEGPDLPGFRYVPGPRGRYMPIRVRRSHIHVALAEAEEDVSRRGRSGGKSEKGAKKGRKARKASSKAGTEKPEKEEAAAVAESPEIEETTEKTTDKITDKTIENAPAEDTTSENTSKNNEDVGSSDEDKAGEEDGAKEGATE